jgi:DNA-binding FadR family transcriptional regulator
LDEGGTLIQLRAWLAQRELPEGGRLPPERELCDLLGVSRGELRKALARLEADGELWRHVGRGTFLGLRPVADADSVPTIAARSNPREVMRARLLFEPMLAQEAALNATSADLDEIRRCVAASREAASWRQYENCDNRLHHTVAVAAGNTVLRALFDQLNAIRRAVVWGRRRDECDRPPRDHHSFAEHDRLVAAISQRDASAAARAMRLHLESVEAKLLRVRETAD